MVWKLFLHLGKEMTLRKWMFKRCLTLMVIFMVSSEHQQSEGASVGVLQAAKGGETEGKGQLWWSEGTMTRKHF